MVGITWRLRQGEPKAVKGEYEAVVRKASVGFRWIIYGPDGISVATGHERTEAEAKAQAERHL